MRGNIMLKILLGYDFEYVQDLLPVLNKDGSVKEFAPQEGYINSGNLPFHKYGDGTFCRFSIHPKWAGISGVYVFFINDELKYVGQALDLLQRFNVGYGNISPRNCYIGGQSTNCKINKLVLKEFKKGQRISVYFHITNNFNEVEEKLIKHFIPPYNTALRNNIEKNHNYILKKTQTKIYPQSKTKPNGNPSVDEVRKFIESRLLLAKAEGHDSLIIQSGKIHNQLGMINAMPTVCSAMRTLHINVKYEIIEQPPKGNGSRLIFKYILSD